MDTTRRNILTGLALALPAATCVPVAVFGSPGPADDRELIILGEKLNAAWIEERKYSSPSLPDDGKFEAAFEECCRLVDAIRSHRAFTIDGLKVKAMAVAWCFGADEIDLDGDTTDIRISSSIINDLLHLAE
ncbi:hypothetical protein OCK02_02090 [Rhizobium sp. TRM96647]|uniref:hypothetical protein n=1 Tax=unclassified Rhizobium TaxID=2613769 RepID=UPI0021E8A6F4|nr:MULTISPECIES: hypothetical protein [unclassified Rhizobium]MCV3734979.1 hypothetical protein [Rhizobium sp. TRM96647]MCV3757349.1 hypothetical protein [Rhizobium sp. TRM96650]